MKVSPDLSSISVDQGNTWGFYPLTEMGRRRCSSYFFYSWAIFRESRGHLELRMIRQDAELLSQRSTASMKKNGRDDPILAHVGK